MLPEASTLAAFICTLGKCARVLLGLEAAAMAGSADRMANRAIRSVKTACSILVLVYCVDCSVIRPLDAGPIRATAARVYFFSAAFSFARAPDSIPTRP